MDEVGNICLAVVLHLYYVELTGEFEKYLKNIGRPFDLFITTDTEQKKLLVLNHPISKIAANTDVRIAPNRGRDIAPKLITCADIYDNYELVLMIHSKKSGHSQGLSGWRSFILNHLLGDRVLVDDIFRLFNNFPDLGMIAPRHFKAIDSRIEWGANFQGCKEIANRMGIVVDKTRPIDFPSGAMFWARPQALKPLLDLKLKITDFESEEGQLDGTLAHQIERMFYYSCEISGHTWLTIAREEMFRKNERTVRAKNLAAIKNLLKRRLLP